MIKVNKHTSPTHLNSQLSASKLYQYFPQRKHTLKQTHVGGKQVHRKNRSQILHIPMSNEQEQRKLMYRSQCNKISITHRFSECEISKESKIQNYKQQKNTSKVSEIEKITLRAYNKFTNTYTERNNPHKKWAQTIIRRKNNGSYGQIIKGLTGSKHEKVLQKVKEIIGKEALTKSIDLVEDKEGEQFVPLGSPAKDPKERYFRKCNRLEKDKLKLLIKRKKTTIESVQSKILHEKTQPQEPVFEDLGGQQEDSNNALFSKGTFRKVSIPAWNQRQITPWNDQSFL